jgi:hypothetical protein
MKTNENLKGAKLLNEIEEQYNLNEMLTEPNSPLIEGELLETKPRKGQNLIVNTDDGVDSLTENHI